MTRATVDAQAGTKLVRQAATPGIVDLNAALAKLTMFRGRTPRSTMTDRKGTAARLATYRDGALTTSKFAGTGHWEAHPGDELIHIIDGTATLEIVNDDGPPKSFTLRAGMMAVNPQGAWHRFHSSEGVTLMTATPFPSEVIELDVDDPRTVERRGGGQPARGRSKSASAETIGRLAMDAQGIVVLPGRDPVPEGRLVAAQTAACGDTGDSVMVFEETVPAGTRSTLHLHHHSDEVAYVLSGEVTFLIGDEVTVGGPGSCAFMPRGVPHAWKSTGAETGGVLFLYTPAKAGGLLEEQQRTQRKFASMTKDELAEICQRHGWAIVGESPPKPYSGPANTWLAYPSPGCNGPRGGQCRLRRDKRRTVPRSRATGSAPGFSRRCHGAERDDRSIGPRSG